VLFFDGSDAYSLSGADAMRAGMAAIGGEILLEVDLSTTPSLDAVVTGPEAEAADAFLIPTFTETAAPVLVALRSAGHQQPVIGGEAMASLDLVRLAGDAADGTYVDSTWNAEQPGDLSRAFVDAYMKEYGHTPDNYAAVSYASIYLLMDALKRAGSTKPADLRLALATTSDLDTVLGPLSMSADGDAIFQPVLQQFRSGKLVVLE
jgi:branched-chain amino acid transport system substrate-binding protein